MLDFTAPTFIEKDRDFATHGRWTVGPDGRVYTAESFDRYRITIYDPAGDRLDTIEWECTPRSRSALERRGPMMMIGGRRFRLDEHMGARDPCIKQLRVTDAGVLWVLSGQGDRGQSAGAALTFDLFDPRGRLQGKISPIGPINPSRDEWFWLSDDRLLVVRRTEAEGDEKGSPELVLYRLPVFSEGD